MGKKTEQSKQNTIKKKIERFYIMLMAEFKRQTGVAFTNG